MATLVRRASVGPGCGQDAKWQRGGGRRCSHEAIAASGPVAAGSLVAARYPAAALAKGLLISIGLLIVGAELSDDHLAGAGFTWKAGRFTTTTLTSARS